MVALVIDRSSDLSGSILPVTVAAELELNSISPPPDMVEEEKHKLKEPFKLITCWGAAPGYSQLKTWNKLD